MKNFNGTKGATKSDGQFGGPQTFLNRNFSEIFRKKSGKRIFISHRIHKISVKCTYIATVYKVTYSAREKKYVGKTFHFKRVKERRKRTKYIFLPVHTTIQPYIHTEKGY